MSEMDQCLPQLVLAIVVVEVLSSMKYFGTGRVVVVVCMPVVLFGYHPRNLFYVEGLERVDIVFRISEFHLRSR